jgi:hypothetical protein
MLRKPIALLFAVAIVVTLAACGGDDSGSIPAPGATSGSSGSDAPAASSDTGGSDSGSAGTTAVPDFSGSGGEAFCGQAKDFESVFGGESFSNTDPASLKSDYEKAKSALDDLASKAPDEIKSDVETLSGALSTLMEVFESVDYDVTKLAQDPTAAAKLQDFDTQELSDASARVEAYLTQVCGIDTTTGG